MTETTIKGRYGRKGAINANQMAAISALEPEIVKQMREILMAAKNRAESAELIVLKPRSKKRAGRSEEVGISLQSQATGRRRQKPRGRGIY